MSKSSLPLNKVPIVIKKKSSFTINQHLFRDTIIYDSKDINYFKEKYQRVTLFNRQNIINNYCRLIAKIGTKDGEILEITSDSIVKMIGQEQFEVLFMALCSIINQEIRIRGLVSILTSNKVEKSDDVTKKDDKWTQTDETRLAKVNVNRKRRMRRHLAPYVVHDFKVPEKIKKVIIDVSNFSTTSNDLKDIPDLGYLHDENSSSTNISNISGPLKPELHSEVLKDPMVVINKYVDKHTNKPLDMIDENPMNFANEIKNNNKLTVETIQQNNFNLILPDKTSIMLQEKPDDHFHIATEENLKFLDINSRRKLIEIQRIIDWKFCMTPVDDEGNLPIHMAVLNEDLHLLKRQCFMLNLKEASVDIEANGLTPLKLSLFNQSVSATSLLLTSGADPLSMDDTHSTYFHTAAELNTEHLSVVLQYCYNNVRSIISENEDLQLPGWETRSDEELSSYLMDHICSICDSQGYTPLMLATNLGLYSNVRALLAHSPTAVNTVNPTTGNTPLYLAVVAACNVAAERGNKSQLIDHFRKTIETLLDYGADTTIENYSGSNISVLLTDFQCPELSTLIANRGPASKYNSTGNYNTLMFLKDGEEMKLKDNKNTMQLKNFRKIKDKPVIDNIVLNNHSDPEFELDSIKCQNDLTKTNSTESNVIEIHADTTDLTKILPDTIKSNSNVIQIESDSNLSQSDSNKSDLNPKLIQIKKSSNVLESNEKSIKLSSSNIISNKPDKILLTSVKLIELDKSNDSNKTIGSSINPIKKVDPSLIIESISNIRAKNSQNIKSKKARSIPNITFADFEPNTKSNEFPSSIRFLYSPNVNTIKRKSNSPLVISIPNKNQSIARPINIESSSVTESLTKAKPKVYIKKSISNPKKQIKKEINSNICDDQMPLKTYKRKLSGSE